MASTATALSQNPIFVVGCPRSGTTLLQALLSTQGDLRTFPETHFFCTVFASGAEFVETVDMVTAENILAEITERSGWHFEDDFLKKIHEGGAGERVSVKIFFEALVHSVSPEDWDGSSRWLEKTPDHGLCMEHILSFYPEAKFVGIVRNPFFAIHSKRKHFPPPVKDLLTYLAEQWLAHVNAFEVFKSNHFDSAYLVRYEDLTTDTVGCMKMICRFLDVDFVPEKLADYHRQAESIIRPFEHWKQEVKSTQIFSRNENPRDLFSTSEILKIQSITLKKMQKYNYQHCFSFFQRLYNLFG